jgi:hypothetical protein
MDDDTSTCGIERKAVPELLDGPFRRRVFRQIPVHDPACAGVEDDEDVQPLKRGGHDEEEVAGENGAGVIVEERCP